MAPSGVLMRRDNTLLALKRLLPVVTERTLFPVAAVASQAQHRRKAMALQHQCPQEGRWQTSHCSLYRPEAVVVPNLHRSKAHLSAVEAAAAVFLAKLRNRALEA